MTYSLFMCSTLNYWAQLFIVHEFLPSVFQPYTDVATTKATLHGGGDHICPTMTAAQLHAWIPGVLIIASTTASTPEAHLSGHCMLL
jgi:hypothetical protein